MLRHQQQLLGQVGDRWMISPGLMSSAAVLMDRLLDGEEPHSQTPDGF
jgi:hypothetical protein